VFAWGANRHLAGEYKLKMTECAELCRIALDRHITPVTRILAIAIKMLKRNAGYPAARELCRFDQGHDRRIYQASNWYYVGQTEHEAGIKLNGKLTHRRTINSKYGTSDIEWLRNRIDPAAERYEGHPKFKYLLPLDDEITQRVKLLSKPYPQRVASRDIAAPDLVWRGRGSTERGAPICPLQLNWVDGEFSSISGHNDLLNGAFCVGLNHLDKKAWPFPCPDCPAIGPELESRHFGCPRQQLHVAFRSRFQQDQVLQQTHTTECYRICA
jgi:hypothetical protein